MAADIRASAEREFRPPGATGPSPPPDPLQGLPFPANDPVRSLAADFMRLILQEFDEGYDTFRRRGLDLEASRTGLLCAVVENPERYGKIKDRRLYVRKWLLNERARRPV